ncbi:MAG: glycosyltransferase, partial [Candidatus Acidiferrales bacterium]
SRSEGMSNSLLEAMGMSVPVLVRAIDANRNLVREGRTGLLFRNTKEFARQAERLLSDAALRRKLAARARSLVRLRHDPEIEAAAHLRLYRRLLKEQPRA